MKKCAIIAAMPMDNLNNLIAKDTFVIAVDKGYQNAVTAGIKSNLLIGDWDSAPLPNVDIDTIVLPKEKDDTDTYYAAKWAVKNNYDQIDIYCGTGGRLEHTLANINTLMFLQQNNKQAKLYGKESIICLCTHKTPVTLQKQIFGEYYVSVFAYNGTAYGVYEQGFKYPLNDATLKYNYPIGISNQIISEYATIKVKKGVLLIILSPKMPHQM